MEEGVEVCLRVLAHQITLEEKYYVPPEKAGEDARINVMPSR